MDASGAEAKQEIMSIAKNVIFLVAIYAYFIGWVYAYFLFGHFGIPLASVEIPFYFFFVYSYQVIANWWAVLILIAILRLIYVFAVASYHPTIVAAILMAVLPAAFHTSMSTANREARLMRLGAAKTISFVFAGEVGSRLSKEFLEANKNQDLKLITQTPDRFFVLHQPLGKDPEIPYGFTYILSTDDTVLAKVEMRNTSKEGLGNDN